MESIYIDKNWNKLQEKKENGQACEYIYEDINGKITYPFIMRKTQRINEIEYYDIVTARGESGPRITKMEGNKSELLIGFKENFQEYCRKKKIIAEYIRFDPWNNGFEDFKNIYQFFSSGNIYCNDLTKDFFLEEYSSSVRNMVRKAEKSEVKVEFDFKGETVDDFLKLYKYTVEKYDISDYYKIDKDFIKDYFLKLKDKVFIVNAYINNEIISTAIMLEGKDIMHFHFSATNPEYRNLQPNTYLLYKTELYAQQKGKKLFDFGGATPNSNLEKFKFNFINKKQEKLYRYIVGVKIQNKEIYEELVKRRGERHEGYFPEYR